MGGKMITNAVIIKRLSSAIFSSPIRRQSRSFLLRLSDNFSQDRSYSSYSTNMNITYSGGQAINGQGGYYGSGGSRSTLDPTTSQKEGLVAIAADVEKVKQTMKQLETLESLLQRERDENPPDSAPTGRSIEIRSSIKKLMTSPDFGSSLNNLEVEGEPVWGLSSEERELIIFAREKFNEC